MALVYLLYRDRLEIPKPERAASHWILEHSGQLVICTRWCGFNSHPGQKIDAHEFDLKQLGWQICVLIEILGR